MGTNEAWLSVKLTRRASIAAVQAAVVASYEARGAKLGGRDYDATLVLDPPGKRKRIGVAIGRSKKGWASIVDSLKVTSDAALARDIADALETTVFRESVLDAAGYSTRERFGLLAPPRAAPPAPEAYTYSSAPELGARFLVFEGITDKIYDAGPVVRIPASCSCGFRSYWALGADVPSAPLPSDLLVMRRAAREKKSARVLIGIRCPACERALGWATAKLVEGLVVSADKLAEAPRRRDAFDFALASQKADIDRLLPPRGLSSTAPSSHSRRGR